MTELPNLLTPAEAAAILKVSDKTFRKLDVRGIMIGRRMKYTPQDLAEYIERHRECQSTNQKPRLTGSTIFAFPERGFTDRLNGNQKPKQKQSSRR